jgi:photosystem II stability/assembly factor-like uncharacterized protein
MEIITVKFNIRTISLYLFVLVTVGYSQGNWELLIPSGTSNQMVSLYFTDELNGWSVGQYGTITKTSDGGITWEIIEIEYLTDLTDVYFPTESVGYIVGEDGLILKTSNAGITWNKLDNAFVNNLNRVKFRNSENGWVIGEAGLVLHTSDGGDTWNQQTSNCQYSLNGIEIPDGQKVWIVGEDNALLFTGDDGANWQMIDPHYSHPLGDNIDYNYRDVFFADDSSGWACGDYYEKGHGIIGGFIAQTLDAGNQWFLQKNKQATYEDHARGGEGPLGFPQQIFFKDNLVTGLCLVSADAEDNNNIPFYTNNRMTNWKVFIDGVYEKTRRKGRFQFLTDSRVINTGFQGDIRFSDDNGQNWYFNHADQRFWTDFQIGPDNKLHVLQCRPIGSSFYDHGDDYKHLISKNNGTTWEEVSSTIHYLDGSEEELHDIDGLGQFTLTSDPRLFVFHWSWNDTSVSILCSDDIGTNYYELHRGVPIRYYDTEWKFLTPDTIIVALIMSDTYNLLCETSYDGGETITSHEFQDVWNNLTGNYHYRPTIKDSYFFNSHTGFIVGDDGNIVKTEDAGQSWTNIYSGVVEDLWDIEFINSETGFVVGDFGRILKTMDGGVTWRKTDSGTQEDIYSIAFLDESDGWVGTETGMRYTTDGGESWHGVPLHYQHGEICNIKFDHDGNGYGYTFCSAIPMEWELETEFSGSYVMLQRMLSNETGINDLDKTFQLNPEQIILFENYPNPFNSSTHIEYYLPQEGIVSIKIFNITGQLLRTLVNESQKSGHYSVTWDGYSDFGMLVSSGIYIYQLRCNGQIKNRKLLLIK